MRVNHTLASITLNTSLPSSVVRPDTGDPFTERSTWPTVNDSLTIRIHASQTINVLEYLVPTVYGALITTLFLTIYSISLSKHNDNFLVFILQLDV